MSDSTTSMLASSLGVTLKKALLQFWKNFHKSMFTSCQFSGHYPIFISSCFLDFKCEQGWRVRVYCWNVKWNYVIIIISSKARCFTRFTPYISFAFLTKHSSGNIHNFPICSGISWFLNLSSCWPIYWISSWYEAKVWIGPIVQNKRTLLGIVNCVIFLLQKTIVYLVFHFKQI